MNRIGRMDFDLVGLRFHILFIMSILSNSEHS